MLDQVRTSPFVCVPRTDDCVQTASPSLREILAAFKFSKGQDGDCQLLLAVLNAKSAEDQVISPPIHPCEFQRLTSFPCAANYRDRQPTHASA